MAYDPSWDPSLIRGVNDMRVGGDDRPPTDRHRPFGSFVLDDFLKENCNCGPSAWGPSAWGLYPRNPSQGSLMAANQLENWSSTPPLSHSREVTASHVWEVTPSHLRVIYKPLLNYRHAGSIQSNDRPVALPGAPPDPTPRTGQAEKQYRRDFIQERRLGKGGFGTCYKVKEKVDNKVYAVKKIMFCLSCGYAEKSLKEAQFLACLSHPNIVSYKSAWIESGTDSSVAGTSESYQVLPEAKPRTKRWVSSSVPESLWNEPAVNQCSPDYFVNNFLNPVLFCEALRHVPSDAIVVEIAPHCLLQSVLGRGTGARASVVGLMKRNVDNLSFFLSSLGKLHTLGVQMDLSPLYPPVPWPVPRGTPSIGHLVAWDHSQRWGVVGWKDCITLPEGRDLFSETAIRNDVQEIDEDSTSENNPEEALLHSVAQILGFEDPSSINPTISLVDLGMDSGMGVEVLHAIERFCGVVLCMQEVQRCTINALLEISGRTGTRQAA